MGEVRCRMTGVRIFSRTNGRGTGRSSRRGWTGRRFVRPGNVTGSPSGVVNSMRSRYMIQQLWHESRRQIGLPTPVRNLLRAYQELQAAEAASGARLGCARGGDMSDPETVRVIARLLNDHADKFQ